MAAMIKAIIQPDGALQLQPPVTLHVGDVVQVEIVATTNPAPNNNTAQNVTTSTDDASTDESDSTREVRRLLGHLAAPRGHVDSSIREIADRLNALQQQIDPDDSTLSRIIIEDRGDGP